MAVSKENKRNVLAIFGSAGLIGANLLFRIVNNRQWKKIVCFDLLAPRRKFANSSFYKIDLCEPTINRTILRTLEMEKVDTVLHVAFTDTPSMDPEYLHNYECIGTLQILAACAQAKVKKIVVQGTTLVYGAHPRNQMYSSEEQPFKADLGYDYLREKIDVENQVASFMKTHPEIEVTMLRLATIVGKNKGNFMYRYLRRPVVQTVLGYDPLWQVLHIDDGLDVIETALTKSIPGVYNYGAPGVLPLSTIIRLMGGVRVPTPYTFFKTELTALRLGQLLPIPPQHLNFFKFGCLADCTRAFKVLGKRPKKNIQQALAACTDLDEPWEDMA